MAKKAAKPAPKAVANDKKIGLSKNKPKSEAIPLGTSPAEVEKIKAKGRKQAEPEPEVGSVVGAAVVAPGAVVDGAVVVVENIVERLGHEQEAGHPRLNHIFRATSDVIVPVSAGIASAAAFWAGSMSSTSSIPDFSRCP